MEAEHTKNPLVPAVLFPGGKVATASGKVNLMTDAVTEAEPAPEGYPLFLMSVSSDRSQSSQWPRKPVGPAVVTVHPDAAAGIPDGGAARLESRIGVIVVKVKHDPRQRRDVCLTPKGGHRHDGRCMNSLVRARLTDAGEGAAYYDERVRLIPL
jgi:anaerobic selenocysteine-containing dehydrogenase